MDLEILKKQNKLTVNSENLIYVKPIDKTHYQTHPLNDLSGCLVLKPTEFVLLKANYYRFSDDLTKLEVVENE